MKDSFGEVHRLRQMVSQNSSVGKHIRELCDLLDERLALETDEKKRMKVVRDAKRTLGKVIKAIKLKRGNDALR